MDDMERYGDYNEVDESPKKSPVLKLLSLVIILAIAAVAALLIVRICLYNYYPDSMKSVYVDDKLISYYEKTSGNVGAKTQSLRSPYDDPNVGSFYCDNLIVIDELGRVQITLRYNNSAIKNIEQKYGMSGLDPKDEQLLEFTLYRNNSASKIQFLERDKIGTLVAKEFDSYAMYGYYKLVFDDVELGGEDAPKWLSLAISVKGSGAEAPFGRIPIYENSDEYSKFESFEIKDSDIEK